MESEDQGKRSKLNARTFAVRDSKGNIFVTVPVLTYTKRDPGYDEMAAYFTEALAGSAVELDSNWCMLWPLNSSTNNLRDDDDDDK